MKVTIVAPACYASSGGPSKSIHAFQKALDAQVIAWVEGGDAEHEPLAVPADAVVRSCNLPVLRKLLYPRQDDLAAAEELFRESDLVSCHLFWRWHCPWAHGQAARTAIPYWLVPHGGLDPYVFRTNGIAKRLFAGTVARGFLADAPAIVCSTRREFEKARQHLPHARPFILPWPLEPADFRRRREDSRKAVRDRFGIPADAFCLLFLGRLHRMKRPLETIEAVARCPGRKIHLMLVGNDYGITEKQCQDLAESLGIADRVHVTGPVYGEDKASMFDAADAFISLSHRENFNFAAAEALAAGIPVILSPGNDLIGDLCGVDCGWMLSRVESAADVIHMAAGTAPESLRLMGQRGREWAEHNLQFETFQRGLREFADQCSHHRRG